VGGVTHRLDAAPKGAEDILAQLAQALQPGALGQSPQDTEGHMLVPSAYARQLMGTSTAKEGGKHEAKDFAEQPLLGSQAAFDLDDEVSGQAEVIEGLAERFDIALGLALLVCLAFLGVEATTFDRFGLLFGISFLTVRPFSRWFRRNGTQPCIER
jgi:hypothetical protein